MTEILGPHALFILLAWAAAVLIVAGLVAWVTIDHRAQRRILAALDNKATTERRAP